MGYDIRPLGNWHLRLKPGLRLRRRKRPYKMTLTHLAWLRALQNPLSWWMINGRLEKLNDGYFDPQVLDRTLEFGEALDSLDRQPGTVTSKGCSEEEYLMQGYMEFLEEYCGAKNQIL